MALIVVLALAVAPLGAQRPSGGGQLAGVILIDDGGQSPVRGAIVTISAPELARPRSMITDAAGAFSFANLPAGRFALTATKAPFLSMMYGAARPGRQGTSIRLLLNESLKNIILRLPRGGVITGLLRDQLGAPVEGVTVSATSPNASVQASSTPQLPSATTDDRGVYRIFGLMPGNYFVAATFSSLSAGPLAEVSRGEMDRRLAELGRGRGPGLGGAVALPAARPAEPPRDPGFTLAPTFYPGTTDAAAATLVTVASGEERNADFILGPVRAGVIEGVIRTADGSAVPPVPAGSAMPSALIVALDPMGPQLPFGLGNAPTLQLRPSAADGRFRFTGVAPGKYALSAATMTRSSENIFASVDVSATGDDITGLALTLDRGPRLSGSVRFVGTTAQQLRPQLTRRQVVTETTPDRFDSLLRHLFR